MLFIGVGLFALGKESLFPNVLIPANMIGPVILLRGKAILQKLYSHTNILTHFPEMSTGGCQARRYWPVHSSRPAISWMDVYMKNPGLLPGAEGGTRIYGLTRMRKFPMPGSGKLVHTGTALDDSRAAEVDLAVAVKVHHPAGMLVKV